MRQDWTEEDDEIALRLFADGASATEIAIVLNRTKNSVVGRLWRLRQSGKRASRAMAAAQAKAAARAEAAARARAKARAKALAAAIAKAAAEAVAKAEALRSLRQRISWDQRPKPPGQPAPFFLATGCRWVLADRGTWDAPTCNAKRVQDSPWCEEHFARVYNIPELQRRKMEAAE